MAQRVKNLGLSLLWLGSLLWLRFGSCPGNCCMLWAQQEKKKKSTPVLPSAKAAWIQLFMVVEQPEQSLLKISAWFGKFNNCRYIKPLPPLRVPEI